MMKTFAFWIRESGPGDGMGVEVLVGENFARVVKVSNVVLSSVILAGGVIVDDIARLVEGLVKVRNVVFDTSTSAVTR